MADKKISELDSALQINNDAVFPMSQDNAGEPTTFKAGITQLGTKIAEDMTFSNLGTTSKKLVGAINELLSLGNPIILGTSAPTSSQGADGNLYIQYTVGTGGADDEVDGIFVKIDGAWCEISTGGSGTTDYEDLSNKPQVNSVELVGNKSLDDLGIMPASLSKTVSGSIVHITDGADNIPVKSLVSQIVAVETGSGEKSPDNPYTISGFDSGVITRCGKNFLNAIGRDTTKGFVDRQFVTDTGALSGANTFNGFVTEYFPLKANTQYVISGITGGSPSICFYDKEKNFISGVKYNNRSSFTFTTDGSVAYARASIADTIVSTAQIEKGSTATTTYEPYIGNTYTFTFGQTVFGGRLNVTTGVLTIDTGYKSTTWSNFFGETVLGTNARRKIAASGGVLGESICNVAPYLENYSQDSNHFYVASGVCWLFMPVGTAGTTPIEFTYKLGTPITVQLTPTEVKTLLGENNIFSNCGDVEVNYYTDNADEIVEVAKATASKPLHNYSTDEQVVGTWIDGSTIYEKTFDLGSDVIINYNAWTETSASWQTLNVDRLVGAEGSTSSGGTFAGTLLASKKSNGNIEIQTPRNGTATGVRYLTIRYTKSST